MVGYVTGDAFPVNISVTDGVDGKTQEHDTKMYRVMWQSLQNSESVILGDFNLSQADWQAHSGVERVTENV